MHRTTSSLAAALLLLSGAGRAAAQGDPPRFRSEAQVVVLDVVASDRRGQPVADLRQDELQVFEDGKACELRSASRSSRVSRS